MRLRGKTALVTGAASGIGRAIAQAFVREGARVAFADLDGQGAEAAARAADPTGGQAIGLAMDVTQEAQVEAGTRRTLDELGGLDVLVANAGIQIVARVEELSLDQWRRMLAVHLDGAFLTTRAALRHMYGTGGGCILYMGSVHSKLASRLKAPYVTAKHGLLGLARVVAKEGADKGVRTHVICPGFVRTPLVEKQIPEQARTLGLSEDEVVRQVMLRDTVDGAFTTLEEVAEVAVFLAAFPTLALTGQSVLVSHGWCME
ncbi:MAG: 3-hydroxybutyrate dehydrogenase [Thermaurantiacus sp.]|uniref:3-hydroxybutyrate dehydrogenase n=1 Tax=Thermaurantiacus sp. TaxID=2820283 RepID=UPI00298EE1A9|nr:3-hydroxybutyrate dehydrogenase [Thermaurantiacus sp.]MDW8415192.1 3-hydroxybutyrate dehydrogenase [Thermaurantiacus sp.]